MIKRVISVVLAFSLLLTVSGCGRKEPVPADTIRSFQDAFNRYDLDGMLECVEPLLTETVRALLNSEGSGSSLKYSLILALIKLGFPVLPLLTNGAVDNDDLPKLILVCKETTIDGENAEIPVDGTLTVGDAALSFHVLVRLRKGDNLWYINGLGGEESESADIAANTPREAV